MVLKFLCFEEKDNDFPNDDVPIKRWTFIDGISEVAYFVMHRDNPKAVDSAHARERGVRVRCSRGKCDDDYYFCWNEAYLLSDDGKTIERLN